MPSTTEDSASESARPQTGGGRLRLPAPLRQFAFFVLIGGVTTAAYAALYVGFVAAGLPDQLANAISVVLTAMVNTAGNRRVTFSVTGTQGAVKHQMQGLLTLGVSLAITSSTLAVMQWIGVDDVTTRALVLMVANGVAGIVRFALLRYWVFR